MLCRSPDLLLLGFCDSPKRNYSGFLKLLFSPTLEERRPWLMGFYGESDIAIPFGLHQELAHDAPSFYGNTLARKRRIIEKFSGVELHLEKMYSRHILKSIPAGLEMELVQCRADPLSIDVIFSRYCWFNREGGGKYESTKTPPELRRNFYPYFEESKFSVHLEPASMRKKDLFKVPGEAVAYFGLETWLRPWLTEEQLERYGARFFYYSYWELVSHVYVSDGTILVC